MRGIVVAVTICLLVAGIPIASAQEETNTSDPIKVGVIDFSYDIDHPAIKNKIDQGCYEAFGQSNAFNNEGSHGSAVAELATKNTENVELCLAAAPQTSSTEYSQSIDWLLDQDVDVIVVALGYYNTPGDGTSAVSQATQEAANNGVPVVVSAGNSALEHWQGVPSDSDSDNFLSFEGSDERNKFEPTDRDGDGQNEGTVYFSRVDWDTAGADAGGYNLIVETEDGTEISSQSLGPTDRRLGISFETSAETVAIRIQEDVEPVEMGALEISTPGNTLEHRVPRGSILAPATSTGAIAVGAYDKTTGVIEPFSAHGPTADGRRGVDIIGPDNINVESYRSSRFIGTSAAAPVVARTVARMKQEDPTLTPTEVETVIQETGDSATSPSFEGGYGKLQPQEATNYSDIRVTNISMSPQDASVQVTYNSSSIMGDTRRAQVFIGNDVAVNKTIFIDGQTTTTFFFEHTFERFGQQRITVGQYATTKYITPPEYINVTGGNNTRLQFLSANFRNATQFDSEVARFKITADNGTATVSVENLSPGRSYSIYRDGRFWRTRTANQNGVLTFKESSWETEEHTYTIRTGGFSQGQLSQLNTILLAGSFGVIIVAFGLMGYFRRRQGSTPTPARIEWID